MPLTRRFKPVVLSLLLGVGLMVSPAGWSLVKIDSESIDLALKYGMQNQNMGYSSLLGPNWMEGPDGVLLNIYTPFMLLATAAAKGGFSEEPDAAELKKAREKNRRLIRNLTDPKARQRVKFAVSLYGKSPDFAFQCRARIEGFGRGKTFRLNTVHAILQKQAKPTEEDPTVYEAIDSFYFSLPELEVLDTYQFILQPPDGEAIVFPIKNSSIY